MMYRIACVVLLLVKTIGAQSASVRCCYCRSSEWTKDVTCLSAEQMRDHVDHIEPLKASGLDKGLNL